MSNCVKCGAVIIVDYRVEKPMCWRCHFSCNPLEDRPSLIPTNCIGSSNKAPHARCIGNSIGVPEDINMGCSAYFFNDHEQTTKKVDQQSDYDSEEAVSRLIRKYKIDISFSQFELLTDLLAKGKDVKWIIHTMKALNLKLDEALSLYLSYKK